MSSSPSSFSTPAAVNSKRHSLNISTGPRPLHLVDGNVPSLLQFQSGPATAPLASSCYPLAPEYSASPSSSKTFNGFNHKPRRQSSISYHPRDRNSERDLVSRSPLSPPRFTLSRSNSLGPKVISPASTPGDRHSVRSEANTGILERPPLTLAEKHSELLHFIAQKESKCLELRTQLALHEAELLQLKRKWERIVSRGFGEISSEGTPPAATHGQGSGAMLEGIREGVQGVSRFIAAGLAIGELSAPPSSSPAPSHPMRRTHSTAPSTNSSISTTTTKSTRFSQSSASSIGEESPSTTTPTTTPSEDGDGVQVLMVHDTGATPTMSPNPAFMHKQQQRQAQQAEVTRNARSSVELQRNGLVSGPLTMTSKMHRRKSRDVSTLGDVFASPRDSSPPRSASPTSDPAAKREATKAKRASLNGAAFPPVSSIPGLGSIAVGASSPPVSSWVGSVGKKWDELQRGSSFSKSQKRASALFSDVSYSIVSVLSPSPVPNSATASTPPPYYNPNPTSPITASTTSTSLLDDDSDSFMGASSILTPDMKPTPKSTPRMQPLQPPPRIRAGLDPPPKSKPKEDDDEWNW
ncbi:hypothetical protein BDZ94DRAFT_1296653 [Collybia nuda]|uniref:Uncharacterized protein n=1 Tax=Collybia nuda TaxID=64659 RepID=A0A9P5YAK5_9AGAR|nr:hypothetical protein BDZ94DRAFT_1296653 [Collybia nuda]